MEKMKNDRLRIWIDGACEPINPGGTVSYGVVVMHGDKLLLSTGATVGDGPSMSNNVGEYMGLITFLKWYINMKYSVNKRLLKKRPVIYSDSKMLINQMNRVWRAKRGLYLPYYEEACGLMREHNISLSFWWIPREENEEADRLSKEALLKAGVTLVIQ